MVERVLSVRELGRATLARQLLLERESLSATECTGRLAGMQAQEPGPPVLGLWSRLAAFHADELHRAIDEREVVRARMMRGTLHLVPSSDFLRLYSAIAPVFSEWMVRYLGPRIEGVDLDDLIAEATAVFTERESLSAAELRDALAERRPDADVRALAAVVRTGLPLVRVPDGGRWAYTPKAPFTDAERWLGRSLRKRPDFTGLVRGYLGAFGPASVADAEGWLGGGELAPVFERMRPELELYRDGRGREHFDLPGAPRPPADAPAPVRLLPEFDNLMLAHADRSRVIDDEHRKALTTKNLRVRATVLVDGRVAGFWKLETKRGTATVAVEPLLRMRAADRRALEEEAQEAARFLEPSAKAHAVQIGS